MECGTGRARTSQNQSSPDNIRKKSARPQRRKVHEDDNSTRRPWLRNRRRSHSSDGISSDSDSRISDSVPVQPSLKFPFSFKHTIVEEKVLAAAVPKVVQQSDRREAEDYRHQLYQESIQRFTHSRYVGDVDSGGCPTIDLFTQSTPENKEDEKPELMTWM